MRKILWIAAREFTATVFTKAFLIGLLFLPVMIGVSAVVINALEDDSFQPSGSIAIIDPTGRVTVAARQALNSNAAAAKLAAELRSGGGAMADAAELVAELDLSPDFTLIQRPADADLEAEKAMLRVAPEAGGVLAVVSLHPDVIEATAADSEFGSYDLFTAPSIDQREIAAIRSMLRDAIVNLRIEAHGLDRDIVDRLMRIAGAQSITVTETIERESVGGLNIVLPMAFMFLLFLGIMGGGQAMMTSTIEEKSSRVVEVLLSAVSPMQLMTGKLFGHMSVSLLGMSIYLVAGLLVLTAFSLFGFLEPMLIFYLFIFFFIAFFTIGSLMIAIGSAVNELREAQSLMMPVTIIVMLPWFLWMPISRDPDSTLSVAVSMIPPVNTFGMLLRLSSNEPPPVWQVWLSIGFGMVGVYLAIWCAARVFRIGVLMNGKPPNVRTLLRWIRTAS